MIIFKSIQYKNFLSTGNTPIKIKLDTTPTTLIIGTNGSGKSTLLDALCFGLFNKPFRLIKKNQMVKFSIPGCQNPSSQKVFINYINDEFLKSEFEGIYKLMNMFSPKRTLLIILLITSLTGIFGILIESYLSSYISTYLFLIYAFVYYLFTNKFWKKFL
mgnify:CR=1 FL=1